MANKIHSIKIGQVKYPIYGEGLLLSDIEGVNYDSYVQHVLVTDKKTGNAKAGVSYLKIHGNDNTNHPELVMSGDINVKQDLYVNGTANIDGAITIKNGANLTLQSPSDAQTDPGDIVFTGFGGDELCRLYKDPQDSKMLMRFGDTGTSYTMLHSGNSYINNENRTVTINNQSIVIPGEAGTVTIPTHYGLTLQSGAFTPVTYNPTGSAATVNIPTKLSQLTDDVVAGKYLRTTIYGDYNADTLFNDGFHSGHMLSHLPSGSPYGIVHTLSYRGVSNNTKPDYAAQIFTPCGDDSTSPNDMFFRTSLKDSWNGWNKVITDKNISNYALPITGGIINTAATTPLNIKNTQSNPTEVGIRFMFNNDSKGWIGYNTQNGTTLFTYNGNHKLGIKDDGTAYVDSNTLIHSGNIKDQYVTGVYDSYNPLMKITFNYAGDAVTSNPTWLACWNGYTLSYVSPDNVKAGRAAKLKTPRKLWGQSFDGTADVSGSLYSDIWRIMKDSTWNGTFIQSANYDGTSDLGNIYMSAIGGNKLTSFNVWATNSIFSDNVGIGTSPTEKLDVAGNVKANSFIGNASSATVFGSSDFKVYAENSNEINFGGTKAKTNVYFGYRDKDGIAVPQNYYFGSAGGANVRAGAFCKKDSSDSYVLLGGGGHKSLSDFVKTFYKQFTPAESALTNDDVLSATGGFSLVKGTWDYAGNGYLPAGEFGNIDLAGCSVLTFGRNFGGYTQLFITAPTTATPSSKANEILFYNNHGPEYNPGWTRVLTNRNYTEYIPTNTSQLTNNNQTFIGRTDGIISNTDADNFTDSGAYLFQTGNGENNTNFPITGYGILNVFNSPYSNRTTNYIGQLLLGSYNIFYRTKIDTWSDWKRIALTSDIPTKLSQLTDDVVAGKYLPLSGGTMVGGFAIKADASNSATILFSPNNGAINHWLGVNSNGVLWFSNNGWSQQYDILHSGNIGNYEAGSSVWSKGLDRITSISAGGHCAYFYSGQPTLGDNINNAKEGSNAYHLWSYPVNGTCVANGTANIMNLRLQWNQDYLHDIFVSPNYDDVWHRSVISGTCNPWRKFAFTDSNVASATKLQTARTLWGQSFDGTADVSGDINNAAGGIYIHYTNEINSFNGKLYLNHRGRGLTGYGSTNDIVMVGNGGNVGIGTISPSEKLEVNGNTKIGGDFVAAGKENHHVYVDDGSNQLGMYVHADAGGGSYTQLYTYVDGEGTDLTVGYDEVTINTSLRVFDDVHAYSFYQNSDERLKTFGDKFEVDFEKLAKLRKSYFTFNNTPDKTHIGVSAQEVQKICPEIVNTDKDGYLSVDYSKLSVVALTAVDELYKKNIELENRLAKIEAMLAKINIE